MYYISVTVGSNWAVITCSWVTKIGCLTVADICIQIHMNRVKGNSVVEILMGYAKHRIICVLGYFSFWLELLQCQVVFDSDENETGENESSFPNVCVHSAPLHHTQIGRHFLYSVGIILILRDFPSHIIANFGECIQHRISFNQWILSAWIHHFSFLFSPPIAIILAKYKWCSAIKEPWIKKMEMNVQEVWVYLSRR